MCLENSTRWALGVHDEQGRALNTRSLERPQETDGEKTAICICREISKETYIESVGRSVVPKSLQPYEL